jgi:hypothetical protein
VIPPIETERYLVEVWPQFDPVTLWPSRPWLARDDWPAFNTWQERLARYDIVDRSGRTVAVVLADDLARARAAWLRRSRRSVGT